MTLQADGRILVGGQFVSIGGQARNGIARLDPATGLPDSFSPNQNRWVNAFAVQTDGRILAGGTFTAQHRRTNPQLHRAAQSRDWAG